MENFYSANDKNGYGMAFEQRRYAVLRKHFGWVVSGAAVIIIALVWILIYFSKKAKYYENDLYNRQKYTYVDKKELKRGI